MTVPATSRRAGPFLGNGSTTAFPFTFKTTDATEVQVVKLVSGIETALVKDSDYTVTLNVDQDATPGGTITYPIVGDPLATGETLTIAGQVPYSQDTDLPTGGKYAAQVVENALDRIVAQVQQLAEENERSLRLPLSSASASTELPAPEANKFIGWNETADALQNIDPTTLATIVAFGTANYLDTVGDGVTTSFTLPSNPGALANLDIAVGGVTQRPVADYNWAGGTTLTFTSAPTLGATVFARYLQALPQGTTDSSASTFVQSGTGAVTRDAQSKLRELWVTPADFGGGASGVQAALDNAAGRVVRLVGAFSLGSTPIVVPLGVPVDATAAVLTWTSHLAGVTLISSATVRPRWRGGKLVGAGNSAYVGGSVAMRCTGTNNAPAAPTYVLGPEIDGVEIDGWGEYGFFGQYLDGGHFRGSEGVKNIGYGGVCTASCNDFKVYFNVITDVTPGSGGGDAYGTFASRSNGTSETAEPRSYNAIMSHNVVKRVTATGGNGHAVDTHGGVGVSAHGNNIQDCQGGIFFTASSISGVQTLGPKHCAAVGNTIRSTLRTNYGILLSGATNAGVVAEYAEGCVITGNTVEGHGAGSTAGAVRLQATYGSVVQGNDIVRPACNGIALDADNVGFSISGGTITDPYDNSYASPNCIIVVGNNNTGYIGGVSFNFKNAALGTYVAIGSIRTGSALTGLDLDIDRCPHNGIDATHLQLQLGTSSGVNTTGMCEQSGSSALVAGTVTVNFPKRFPSAPKVMVTNTGDLNPVRAATVTASSVTFGGTGTTAFAWRAST